jgi:Cu+-exporting ATPase
MKKEMMIEGMSCNHCKMRVEKALGELEGVNNVSVDLEAKKATFDIDGEVGDAVLKEAVEDAGYDVTAIN